MTTGLTLTATANGQTLAGGAGPDTITDSTFNNVVMHGAQGNDSITSGGSNDTIYGGAGTNTISLTGSSTGDVVFGGTGSVNDSSSGSNTLYTYALGNHNDTLSSGHDVIVARDGTISSHVITTVINNFVDGHDTIELSTTHGNHLVTSANLSSIITSHIADVNGNAVLTLGGETITFTGVHTAALHVSDFTLV